MPKHNTGSEESSEDERSEESFESFEEKDSFQKSEESVVRRTGKKEITQDKINS